MRILYLSCHSILEYDETKLFTEMGHQVLSLGAYQKPDAPQDTKRPGYKGFYDDHLQAVALQSSKENLHEELIEWADVIMIMHKPEWVIQNWGKIKHKRVIWRSIGQSTPDIEVQLSFFKNQGLQVVRYSPKERAIKWSMPEDAMIRFYKDENEFTGWRGSNARVITMAQSMKQRGKFCGFEIFDQATEGLDRKVYGPDNDVISYNGGLLSYEELKKQYRENRAYFYTGTYPASYTLNFMEAMMTGIPIVAIGPELANLKTWDMEPYEVDSIIDNGINGFISDDISELSLYTDQLLLDYELAKEIGEAGRKTAIELFGKEKIKKEWEAFLNEQ